MRQHDRRSERRYQRQLEVMMDPEYLRIQAGKAQIDSKTSKPEWQKRGGRNNSQLLPPYGDDPVDQYWIQRGIEYARAGGKVVCP